MGKLAMRRMESSGPALSLRISTGDNLCLSSLHLFCSSNLAG